MNWLKLKVGGRVRLLNIESVIEIQDKKPHGCILHYEKGESRIVDESFEEIQKLLGVV